MDKTLSDYIKRIQNSHEREKQRVVENRNVWNDPSLTKQDTYYISPEPESIDSDEKINPYSQH
jgi:hypothetical protein